MLKRFTTSSLIAMLMGVCWALPTNAQSEQQPDQQRKRQQDSRQHDSKQKQSPSQQSRLRLDRTGTVTIGIDSDGDGRYDAVESIHYYDLEQAMRRSSQRRDAENQRASANQQRSNQQQTRSASNRSGQDRQQNNGRSMNGQDRGKRQEIKEFSGKIVDSINFNLSDGKKHKFAKVELENGNRVPVDMGRVEQLKELALTDGDQITIMGFRTRVDDQKMISARTVKTDKGSVKVNRENDRGVKRVQGTVDKLVSAKFKDREQEYQIARVDLKGGRTEPVILGPIDKLEKLELKQGDDVQMLVRRGRRNGQPVLVAEQIRANGESVRLSDSNERNADAKAPRRR